MIEFGTNNPQTIKAWALRVQAEQWDLKEKVLELNRYVASQKSEIDKLKEQLSSLKKAGDVSVIGLMEELAIQYEDAYPRSKGAHQRREIANLHKVIGRLKDELREARGE